MALHHYDFRATYRRITELLCKLTGEPPPSRWPISMDDVDWGGVFHQFAAAYGWTAKDVENMTYGQMIMYLRELVRDRQRGTKADNRQKKSRLPVNPDVRDLCQLLANNLAKKKDKRKTDIAVSREFTREKPGKDKKAKSLLRQARRFSHVWNRADT